MSGTRLAVKLAGFSADELPVQKLSQPPEGVALPSLEDLIEGPPTSWLGRRLEWLSAPSPEPVFLRMFDVAGLADSSDAVFVFGARYDLTTVLADGESYDEGFFVEYLLVEHERENSVLHRLTQRGGIAYTEAGESFDAPDYVPAHEIRDPAALSLRSRPHWKASDAYWPTHGGVPMQFVGQMALPKNDVTSSLFTWGETFYLFGATDAGRRLFKVFEQETHGQTAEEHYALEEEIYRHTLSAESNGS